MKSNFSYKLLLPKFSLYLFIHIITIKCEQECPIDNPIFKNATNSCVIDYCTNEQFNNKECIISNKIIKKQWMNDISIFGISNSPIYHSIGKGTNNDSFFEANFEKNQKIFYSLENDGRGFMDESQFKHLTYNNINNLFNTYGNSALFTFNNHKCFFKISFYESIEVYDLVEKKFTNSKIENVLGYNIKSYHNSLLRTNEENVFIYTYITSGNYLAMIKFKLISNDASNCIEIIKTLIEEEKTISKNSRRCLITQNQYIECLDMDEEQIFYIRLYDKNLNLIKKIKLEKNLSPPERAFSTYHEAVFLKNEISIFLYYKDISNNNAKPIALFKNLNNNNLVDLNSIGKITLFKNIKYYLSDSENSFTILNDHYFALASLTIYSNHHLIISLFNLFNNDKSLRVHYFDIPLKNLYDIDYHSNLISFYHNDYIGVHFIQLKNNYYINTMLLFSYGNSSDPEPIYNIFEKYNKEKNNIYEIKLSDYIYLDNNIFCYVLTGIKIISIPDTSTGIQILKKDSKQIKKDEVISLDEILSITYSTNIQNIKKGNYLLIFTPTLEEAGNQDFLKCQINLDYFGEQIDISWNPDKFTGRVTKFRFSVGNCYKNCGMCSEESDNPNEQKCETCFDGFYFEENTQNCFKYANDDYYFNKNKNIFSKCYKNCKTCKDINNGENVQNCLSCKENYLLYNNSNCLNCKYYNIYTNYEQTSCLQFLPNGYYVNNTKYNTIDKCHKNCLSCNKGGDDNIMNCLYCDNQNGYYLLENSTNCYKLPYAGYYLDDDYKIKKCYYMCKTCSSGPIFQKNGEILNMNCDICNNELGFFSINSNPKNCEFKEKIGEYYNKNDNKYYSCYNNCLTCYDKEKTISNNIVMNCLSCNETNGFFLYTKNGNNCLNCKLQNQYVNYQQNKCINDIPNGYYLQNNVSNQIDICYSQCETCSEKGLSDNDMKCNSCFNNFFLDNKNNCVKNILCPKYYYYKSNINNQNETSFIFNEKKCLDGNICHNSLPFYFTHTYECVDNCPIDFLFSKGCKISNIKLGLNKFLSLIEIEYAKGNIYYFHNIFNFNNNFHNYLIKIQFFHYMFDIKNIEKGVKLIKLTEKNYGIKEIKNIDNDNIINGDKSFEDKEIINLDECIKLLLKNSLIENTTTITMIKSDVKAVNYNISDYYFELFDDNYRLKPINLSICYENNLITNNNIDSILIDMENKINKIIKENNAKKFSNIFYTDECYVFASEDGADVLIEDRRIDFPNYYSDLNSQYSSSDNIPESYSDEYINSCPPNCVFDKVDYATKKVHCFCPLEEGYNQNKKLKINSITMKNIKIENNKIIIKPKRNTKSISYSSSKSNIYVFKCINNIPKYFSKNYILIIFTLLCIGYMAIIIIYFIFYRNKYINNFILAKKVQKIITLTNSYNYKMAGPPKNRERSSSLKIMDSNNDIKSSNNFQKNNINKINIINKINNNKNNNVNNIDNIDNIDNINHKIQNDDITLPGEYPIFIKYTDIDLVDYNYAINNDQRSFLELFLSISKKRQIFIFCFIKDNNIIVLKISLLIFCLVHYLIVNLFFFNDKVIHKIYIDKGKYNFGYQIKFILLSALLSCIFLFITKFIFTFNQYPKQLLQVIKCIDASLIIIFLLFIFYWIYIGSFCSVYIKTQKHLIINFVFTFIFSSIYECILTIISCVMRTISLKKKNLPKLYLISLILVSLKK